MSIPTDRRPNLDTVTADQLAALRTDGITAQKGAFTREWAQRMGEDIEVALAAARPRAGGAVGSGPNRYYVEIPPEQLRGFVDLVTLPFVTSVAEATLGPDYDTV